MGFFGDDDKPSGSIQGEGHLDQLGNYYLLKKRSGSSG
jgi:hypothetical protein